MKLLNILLISAILAISLASFAMAANESASNATVVANESVSNNTLSDDTENNESKEGEPLVISPGREKKEIIITKVTKLPNPARIYCENRGFLFETNEDSTGKSYDVCVFPDGKECNSLEFMRGKCGKAYLNMSREQILKNNFGTIKSNVEGRKCIDGCKIDDNENLAVKDLSAERREIIAGKINARTGLNLSAEEVDDKLMLRAYLSNGRWALIKYLPDSASKRAEDELQAKCSDRNCTLELREVSVAGKSRLAYEVKTSKDVRLMSLFNRKMAVTAQVDAENGKVISTERPWWAFLTKDISSRDSEDETENEA